MSTTAARNRFKEFIKSDLWIIMLDIAAVNLAYFLALIMRFYVNNEFRSSVSFYLTYFARYAPVYTVLCLIVFGPDHFIIPAMIVIFVALTLLRPVLDPEYPKTLKTQEEKA